MKAIAVFDDEAQILLDWITWVLDQGIQGPAPFGHVRQCLFNVKGRLESITFYPTKAEMRVRLDAVAEGLGLSRKDAIERAIAAWVRCEEARSAQETINAD